MTKTENDMLEVLKDLKANHHVVGLKLSFEDEGALSSEALRFKNIADEAGVPISLKIGGCEARKDMHDARVLGVRRIVAPMVESAYAVKKYIQAAKSVFPEDEFEKVALFINIETIQGYQNLESILNCEEAKFLSGVVLGRVDLIGSMGLNRSEINSDSVFDIAKDLVTKVHAKGLKTLIGGGVSSTALPFFEALPEGMLNVLETRNVVFDAQAMLKDENVEKGLVKAVYFELLWMHSKSDFYGRLSISEKSRIAMIEERYQKLKAEVGME